MQLDYGPDMSRDYRVGRRLKLRELNVLIAVAETGSMAKAAKQISVSQPAVSRAIADMEALLGVALFDRSPKGVEPTEYGRALLRRGIAAFDELAQGVRDIEFLADPAVGELRVGTAPGLADGVVLASIDRLSRTYPGVVVHVVVRGLFAQYQELRDRRIDLGFAGLAGSISEPDIEHEVLYEEPLIVLAGPKSKWTKRRKIELAELAAERWTWPDQGTSIDSSGDRGLSCKWHRGSARGRLCRAI